VARLLAGARRGPSRSALAFPALAVAPDAAQVFARQNPGGHRPRPPDLQARPGDPAVRGQCGGDRAEPGACGGRRRRARPASGRARWSPRFASSRRRPRSRFPDLQPTTTATIKTSAPAPFSGGPGRASSSSRRPGPARNMTGAPNGLCSRPYAKSYSAIVEMAAKAAADRKLPEAAREGLGAPPPRPGPRHGRGAMRA